MTDSLAFHSPSTQGRHLRRRCDPRLAPIAAKIDRGERLGVDDGLLLYETPDLWTVCSLADAVRRRMHGEVAYYNVNRHINYSNICALSCTFCSFYRKKDQDGAYEFSVEQIRQEAIKAAESGATEIHIVGGLHPWLPFEYYTDMLRAIRAAAPALHIKAFTAVEIVHLARISQRGREGYDGIKAALRDLIEAGLGSLPGGGAEVFDDRVHDEAFKGKIRAGTWLDVHRAAHELGINSNATMLYGHVEQRRERIHHMDVLRKHQDRALRAWATAAGVPLFLSDDESDPQIILSGPHEMYSKVRLPSPHRMGNRGEGASPSPHGRGDRGEGVPESQTVTVSTLTPALSPRERESARTLTPALSLGEREMGYFQTIIPLPFFPDESALERLPGPTGLENLRTLAIARLMLDNFPHVKAFWIMQTLGMAQLMLTSGADDIDGTVVWYDITKLGGADTHQETTVSDLRRAIREAGFKPVERDTLYRPIERHSNQWRVID